MRLKEDSSSYRAIGLKVKYSPEKPSQYKSKKNTRRWCRGKVGVEHEYEHVSPRNMHCNWIKYDVCKNCGRQETRNSTYYCRHHDVWDKKIYWNDNHSH